MAERPVGEEKAGAVDVAPPGRLVLVLHVTDDQLEQQRGAEDKTHPHHHHRDALRIGVSDPGVAGPNTCR